MPETDPIIHSIEQETWNAKFETERVKSNHAVIQYRAIAGVYELFWAEVGIRTNKALWRLEGDKKGVGSCRDVDYDLASDLIGGMIEHPLMRQRDWKNDQAEGERKHCPFFRVGRGCILGNLKSPKCLDHVDSEHGKEIEEKFGFKVPEMRSALTRVQLAGINQEARDYTMHPEVNDQFVLDTLEEWRQRIEYVRTFPILHPHEAAAINYDEILSLEPIAEPQRKRFSFRRKTSLAILN